MQRIKFKGNIKEYAKKCCDNLIESGYIYNKVFGWETMAVIERFGLNPEMKGVPCSLQFKWKEAEEEKQKVTDAFGNVKRYKKSSEWVRSETEKTWYPTNNWDSYVEFKKDANKIMEFKANVPAPSEY